MPKPDKHVLICTNTRPLGHPKSCCTERGAPDLVQEFGRQLEQRELFGRIKITRTSCLGPCELGPSVLVYPDGVMYVGVTAGDVTEIYDEHLIADRPVERLLAPSEVWG